MWISHHIYFYLILARCQWLQGLYTSCFPLTFIMQFTCVIFHLINSWLALDKVGVETEAWHNYATAQTHSGSKWSIKNLNPDSSTSKTQVPNYYASHCCSPDTQSCPTLWDPMHCSTPCFSQKFISQSLLKLMSIESGMPSNHLILCLPLLLLPSVFPRIRVFSNELAFQQR